MDVAVHVVGAVVIITTCLILLWTCWVTGLGVLRKYHERRDEMVRSRAVRDLGRKLYFDAHWFGEHAPTRQALQLIGISLMYNGSFDTPTLRENWRKGEEAEV
jgi:hypothetical protein